MVNLFTKNVTNVMHLCSLISKGRWLKEKYFKLKMHSICSASCAKAILKNFHFDFQEILLHDAKHIAIQNHVLTSAKE